jgi:hypothetical protein
MSQYLEPFRDPALRELLNEESVLEQAVAEAGERYAGLQDIDATLKLVGLRLAICNKLLERLVPAPDAAPQRELIRDKATKALQLLDLLRSANVSEDQKDLLFVSPEYGRLKEELQQFILRGGGLLLESSVEDARKTQKVARAVTEAIRKHAAPDDRYEQAFKTESLPAVLRRLVNVLLPVLARERQQEPPYGIEEGQETVLSSDRMKMPLSQAILYLEREVLPELDEALRADPGDPALQRQRNLVTAKLREYRSITLTPRSTPVLLEKGFYTDWLSQYTADGELLVTVALPVKFKSGTNLERMKELVQSEVVRRLAGKGVCPALDREYRHLRSLQSGRRGSSRLPGFRLDYRWGFDELKALYPGLKRLEDRRELGRLADLIRSGRRRLVEQAVAGLVETRGQNLMPLP